MHMAKFANQINGSLGYCFASEDVFKPFKEETLEVMRYSDFVFCNKQEALAASKYIGTELGISEDESNLDEIARAMSLYPKLNLRRGRVAIITDSSKSVTVAVSYPTMPELNIVFKEVFKVGVDPVSKDKLVDSNGAGDSFVGGFLAEMCSIEKSKKAEHDVLTFTQSELTKAV